MKRRLSYALATILVLNIGLVVISAILSERSMQQYPMQGELVEVHGVKMHVVDSARAHGTVASASSESEPTIVLLHGASTSLLDYATTLQPELQNRYRVISIDRPGHGYSERGHHAELAHLRAKKLPRQIDQARPEDWINPDIQARLIADVVKSRGVRESIWIGHSWAGSVVMAALLDETLNVSAGVLIAGATHPWEGGSAWHVEIAAKPVVGPVFSWQYIEPLGRMALESAVASAFTPEAVPDDYIQNTGLVLSLRPATFQHNAQDRTRLSEFLARQSQHYNLISKPVLSIASDADTVVPAWNHHDRLVEQVPELTSIKLPGAGHAPHHTRTDEIVSIIETFVTRLTE